jgi:hypothetical protein
MQPNRIAQMRENTAMTPEPSNDGSDNRGLAEAVARRANIKNARRRRKLLVINQELHMRWILPLR